MGIEVEAILNKSKVSYFETAFFPLLHINNKKSKDEIMVLVYLISKLTKILPCFMINCYCRYFKNSKYIHKSLTANSATPRDICYNTSEGFPACTISDLKKLSKDT